MKEWTEQEEQEMIERAKAGDPEANYELSLWALSRGEEEPDEPRWNRLAAKCLVKAAQAGYGPAQEQMEEILHPGTARKPTAQKPAASQKAGPTAPISISDARQAAARKAPAHQTTARRLQSRPAPVPEEDTFDEDEPYDEDEDPDGYDEFDDDDGYDDEPAPRRRGGRSGRQAPSGRKAEKKPGRGEKAVGKKAARSAEGGGRWGDAQWRRLEIVCVAICAVLLVFIAVMIFTGRRPGAGADTASAIPPAGDAATVQSSSDPTPAPASEYPDQATKDAIMAADLAIQPEEEDYMTAPTTAAVSVSSQYLRLRKGPNTTYDPIAEMPNETVVDVYATKNDWDLVLFQGDNGPIYGWCSSEYLIITAGTVAGPNAVS